MTKRGFTLIEIAVVLALVGLVTSAGLIMLPQLWHEKQRIDTRKYLLAAKAALLTYATDYNALPVPATPDLLPSTTLKLQQKDAYDQRLRYVVNNKLLLDITPGADKTLPCATLQAYFASGTLTGFPLLWQHGLPEEAEASRAVAAVVISPGANGEFDLRFNDVNDDGIVDPGETIGDNETTDLTVNFVQAPVSESFDDLVLYLSISELINALPECRQ